jgi:hypothetical protein
MAHLKILDGRLRLELSPLEVIGGLRISPEVDLADVLSVEVVPNPWSFQVIKGIRIGTGFPFLILLGIMKYRGGKDFCAIYRRRPSAIVTLKAGPFKRWIFEIKDFSEIKALQSLI